MRKPLVETPHLDELLEKVDGAWVNDVWAGQAATAAKAELAQLRAEHQHLRRVNTILRAHLRISLETVKALVAPGVESGPM